MSSEEERARLCPEDGPGSRPNSRPSSRPSSPLRNQRLPRPGAVGAALQSTVEDLMNRDLDTGVVVNLANSEEAHRELQDLLPIHFFSWNLENVESALVYTLLHMFVVLGQYGEIVRERSTYQDYISNLKGQVSQLEDELNEIKRQTGAHQYESSKDEVLRLRKENAELRSEQAKLQASQNELFQINDAWSRDYHSLTRKIDALTTGNWSTEICTSGTAAPTSDNARTPTQPPSLTRTPLAHHTSAPCTKCCSLQDQVAELGRQVTEFARRNEGLEKSMTEMERKLKQRELMIKSLDNENQAVQLQIQEIGDLQAAARMKEDFRKLEIQMKQKEKQYQDAVTQKVLLQQQVDKLRVAFMSIFGVNGSSRRHSAALRHDCRGHCYMSEPLPPPPTPPGLIARGNHFGSLVEKDRQRMLYDEQVTGFERAAPTNLSLPTDPHSWPKVTKRTPRPNTLIPKSNGHQSSHRYVACPTCSMHFDIEGEMAFSKMFDHVSYCGPRR